jgi:hypothetical protein
LEIDMKLTRNGTLARLYEWSYNTSVPPDLCTFFWGILIAAIFFPISWISFPFRLREADPGGPSLIIRFIVSLLLWAVLALVAWAGVEAYFNPWVALKWSGIIIGGVIAAVSIIVGLAYFFIESQTWEEVKSVVGERKQGFKEKYCPRIDWV